jgi:hypothetical protein
MVGLVLVRSSGIKIKAVIAFGCVYNTLKWRCSIQVASIGSSRLSAVSSAREVLLTREGLHALVFDFELGTSCRVLTAKFY